MAGLTILAVIAQIGATFFSIAKGGLDVLLNILTSVYSIIFNFIQFMIVIGIAIARWYTEHPIAGSLLAIGLLIPYVGIDFSCQFTTLLDDSSICAFSLGTILYGKGVVLDETPILSSEFREKLKQWDIVNVSSIDIMTTGGFLINDAIRLSCNSQPDSIVADNRVTGSVIWEAQESQLTAELFTPIYQQFEQPGHAIRSSGVFGDTYYWCSVSTDLNRIPDPTAQRSEDIYAYRLINTTWCNDTRIMNNNDVPCTMARNLSSLQRISREQIIEFMQTGKSSSYSGANEGLLGFFSGIDGYIRGLINSVRDVAGQTEYIEIVTIPLDILLALYIAFINLIRFIGLALYYSLWILLLWSIKTLAEAIPRSDTNG